MESRLAQELELLDRNGELRVLPSAQHCGRYIEIDGRRLLNLSSNDYLGLATDKALRDEFFGACPAAEMSMSASSSRLLTGNFEVYESCERLLSEMFGGRSALLLDSGYHMNSGILPAVSTSRTLIVADKLVHASIIDGMRLSRAQTLRYRHNDMRHLTAIVEQNKDKFDEIIIATESIFSMDGDAAPLAEMVELKRHFENVYLYVDEAHAIGVYGPTGLGMAEQLGVIKDIDFLAGTLGKALASVGGYLICNPTVKRYLVNKMRTLIFTTALPPINIHWTRFILGRIRSMNDKREHLACIAGRLRDAMRAAGRTSVSTSHIVPMVIGGSNEAVARAAELREAGFYVLPVRPPTVPQGTSRVRFSLSAAVTDTEMDSIINAIGL